MVVMLENMVRWVEDLRKRGGGKWSADPAVGSPKMEVKKFGGFYSGLLEVLLEHAQMEEKVIFPLLTMADPGICKEAHKEHARDLPIMNGIKEVIKSMAVLQIGSPAYKETLFNLATRLKSLKVSYMILQRVSPITHSVENCVKRVVVIVSSVIFFKTPVSMINALGTGIALVGVFLYSRVKGIKAKPKTA